jgi:CHAT domain-containing protein
VQTQAETNTLEPGKPIERTLTGAETHRYQLRLQKGQCAVVQVKQQGIDVAVQLLGTQNDPLVEVDDEIGKNGTEQLEILADHDGIYGVAVKPKLKPASGAYEIRVAEVRAATDRDRTLYEVRQLGTKAHLMLFINPHEALPLIQRALFLARELLGPDGAYVGLLTHDLAVVTYNNGMAAEAKPIFERALQVLTAKLGAQNPQAILVKSRLGAVYITLGEFSQADRLLSQTLQEGERALGRDDPVVAKTLQALGVWHGYVGDFAKAEDEDRRALAIMERSGLTEEFQYGLVLNNLGVLYTLQREYENAAVYYQRALAFEEGRTGPESLAVSYVLNGLGIVARQRKDYPAAEKYYLRALAIKEKHVGPQHPDYAAVLMNLANVYDSEGDYQKALQTHLRALNILEKNSGPHIPYLIEALASVIRGYAAVGDLDNANKIQSKLDSAVESEISLNLTIGSERQKLAYVETVREWIDHTISLNLQLEPDNAEAEASAATALLQRKGRVLDAMTDSFAALRKHSSPEDQALLDQLKEASTQFAQSALKGPQKESLEQHRKALQDLQQKREALESVISRQNDEFRSRSQAVTLGAVQSAIPANCALVEFVTYRPSNPKAQADAERYGDLRYAAYVLHRNAPPKGVDLGDAKAIDATVEDLRAALRDPSRNDVRQLAQAVAKKVFQPLQSLIAKEKRLLISPDGRLDLIPFEALLDEHGRYLIEGFSISYLTTGRDLLRMQVARPSRGVPVIVADPSFGEPQGNLVASAAMPQTKAARARIPRRSVTTGTDFSSLYFAELAGTRTEAESIHRLFPEARVLMGEQASETALEQLNAPKILHIATHGFFLQDTSHQADAQAGSKSAVSAATADMDNPLLRSGLALSGANLVKDGMGEGILTALEASNLNLWGTRLVTLSACDTGVGEVKNGEGVYGLRRSFFLAGAETLVMSLWPVSDYVTREMMTSYYSGLKHGLGRDEALRQAELAMLKRKGREHPFYWASFIQSGEWANLDGQR